MTVDDFFEADYINQASNDAYQNVSSFIDGFKPTQRKIIHTIKKFNIGMKIKVEELANKTAGETEYLGGANNVSGVIVNTSKNYTGSNNLPLLVSKGDFGTRMKKVSAAPRYIFTHKQPYFDSIIMKEDDDILVKQIFEGKEIEPRYFSPIIPLILVNGSSGVGTGFSNDVFPRDPKEIIKHLQNRLNGKSSQYDFIPFWTDFNGTVMHEENRRYQTYGVFERTNSTTVTITELPIRYTLTKYLKILESLVEKGLITSYIDQTEAKYNKYLFTVKFRRTELAKLSDDKLIELLKLREAMSEVLVCMDENNYIIEFSTIQELFEHYYNHRLQDYKKRKEDMIQKIEDRMTILEYKSKFISEVNQGVISITDKSKKEIIAQLESYMKIDGNHDYLLGMPVYSLTQENEEKLLSDIEKLKQELSLILHSTEEQLWLSDLKKIRF